MNMSQHHGQRAVTRHRIRAFAHLAFICALSLLAAKPASACITIPDDPGPTTYETVQLADAVVVAIADADPNSEGVRFRIDRVLKGSPPQDFIETSAHFLQSSPRGRRHPGQDIPDWGWLDTCGQRVMFAKGAHYLLFLERLGEGRWRRLDFPLFLLGDDPYEDDTRWIPTIKAYLDIQDRFGPMEQLAELERLLAAKQAARPTPQRKAEIRDIADHLQSPTRYKPTPYLLDRYERQTHARPFLLRQLALGRHPGAIPLFESLLADPALSAETLGTTIRFFATQGDLRRALDIAETRVPPKLAELDGHEVASLHDELTMAMKGSGFAESEAWRSDPALAERWPRMSFLLTRFVHNTLGPGYLSNPYAIDLIGNDYRRSPELTLQAANAHSSRVEEWAIAELTAPVPAATPPPKGASGRDDGERAEDPARLPIRVLVRGSGDERDAAVLKVFCQGGARRMMLIDALGEAADSNDDPPVVERMLSTPGLTEGERQALLNALIELDGRSLALRRPHADLLGEYRPSDWRILLELLIKGERFAVDPIVCTPR